LVLLRDSCGVSCVRFFVRASPAVVLTGLILYGLYAWTNIMLLMKMNTVVIELYHSSLTGKLVFWRDNVR
jgi:hypothetical protein